MSMLFRMAWRNLWRHRRRTWLTISAIAFAATLLIFMIPLQLGMYQMMTDNNLRVFTGHFQIQHQSYNKHPRMRSSIPQATALAEQMRALPGVVAIAVRANGFALASSGSRSFGIQVVGVQIAFESQLSTLPGLIKAGRYLTDHQAREAVLGSALARNLQVKVGDELTLLGSGRDGSIAATIVSVVGIFQSGMQALDRKLIQIPLPVFQEDFGMEHHAHVLAGITTDPEHMEKPLKEITTQLAKHPSLAVLDWDTLLPGVRQMIQADKINAWFMYGMLVLIVTFSILNTFLMSVLERTREFGVMLALGTRPLRIGGLILSESLFIALLGLAIGFVLGLALVLYFNVYGFSYPGMPELAAQFGIQGAIYPQLSVLGFTIGPLALLMSVLLASTYSALQIRALKPVDAMKAV